MKASLIISVYKNVENLKAIIESLEQQTEQDFELIISEDGESQEMAQYINSYQFRWPMQHLTQNDKGWRKEVALNKAIVASKSDWLIFIDGDCILHPRFIEFHTKYKAPHTILAGKRVKLNQDLSKKMLDKESFCLFPYLFSRRGCRYVEEAFFLNIARLLRRPVKHLLGSNMSMSKDDLLEINGFDENYTLPATGEDYDIEWRLIANGCKIVSLRNLAIQYHLWHKENWHDHDENMIYCKQQQTNNQIICKNGITKIQ